MGPKLISVNLQVTLHIHPFVPLFLLWETRLEPSIERSWVGYTSREFGWSHQNFSKCEGSSSEGTTHRGGRGDTQRIKGGGLKKERQSAIHPARGRTTFSDMRRD